MDVALITRYPPPGSTHVGRGIASYSKLLATEIAKLGVRTCVLAERLEGSPGVYEEEGVFVHRAWRLGLGALKDLSAAVRAIRPSIVHLQHELFLFGSGGWAALPPVLLRVLARRCRVVTTVHGIVPPDGFEPELVGAYTRSLPRPIVKGLYGRIMRDVVASSDLVIVHTSSLLQALHGYAKPKCERVIPHGSPSGYRIPSRDDALVALGLEDARRAVFLGYRLPYKGLETLKRAASLLAGQGIEVLIAGGETGDSRATHRGAGSLHGDGPVRRLGFVPESLIPAVMAVADALVFPHRVGLSVSGPLMLAAAAGTPVVVSDVPVLANLVGCPAATFRRADHEDLARTIVRVIEDHEVREDLRRRLAALAKSCSWEIVARQTVQAYQVIGGP